MKSLKLLSAAAVVLIAFGCGDNKTPVEPNDPGDLAFAAGTSLGVNLDQWANGVVGGVSASWQNGNLNGNNSAYAEGRTVPFRLAVEGLAPGTHTIRINYDFTAGGHKAYDFLASVDASEDVGALLCAVGGGGVSSLCPSLGAYDAEPFPADPFVPDVAGKSVDGAITFSGLTAAQRELRIYGGTITSIVLNPDPDGNPQTATPAGTAGHIGPVSGNSTTDLIVTFSSNGSAVLLVWGGHLAQSPFWNGLNDPDGAAEVSGAPWHMRTQQLDNSGNKNQDRSIQPSAIADIDEVEDARITLSPLTATNNLNEAHVVTATVEQDDGFAAGAVGGDAVDGFGPVPAGQLVTFSLLNNTAGASFVGGVNTCTTAGGTGQCSITINSSAAGSVTIRGAASVSVGNSVIAVQSGTAGSSADAQKVYIAGSVAWTKHDGAAALLPGATFELCRTNDLNIDTGVMGADLASPVCVSVADGSAPDVGASAGANDGNFLVTGLLLGRYTVRETAAPTGYLIGSAAAVTAPDMSVAQPSVSIAIAFVNIAPPQLTISKIPDLAADVNPDGTVQPGENAVFKITVRNNAAAGAATATGVVLLDTLPVPAGSGLVWSVTDVTPNTVTCAIGTGLLGEKILECGPTSLAPQASFTVTVSAPVLSSILVQTPTAGGSSVEIDGNLVENGATDWATPPTNLKNQVLSCTASPKVGCAIDLPTGANDNSFGQGTKEDTPVPIVVDGSIPNNKSDLTRFYVTNNRKVVTGGAVHDFLYFAWERVQEPNGTTNMDFEFNQSSTLSANGVTPVRTAGDVLIKYDLSKGGGTLTIGFHRWVTTGSPAAVCEASNSVPCWNKVTNLTVGGSVVQGASNSVVVTDPLNPLAPRSLSILTFGEAALDLQAAGIFSQGVCTHFGAAYLKSRSSDAFTSELKDFIAPIPVDISNCAPVTLNNTARAKATNFKPSGGNLGDWISNAGKIEVTESGSASLFMVPTAERLAVALAEAAVEATTVTVIPSATDALETSGRRELRSTSEMRAGVAEQVGRGGSELHRRPGEVAADGGSVTR